MPNSPSRRRFGTARAEGAEDGRSSNRVARARNVCRKAALKALGGAALEVDRQHG